MSPMFRHSTPRQKALFKKPTRGEKRTEQTTLARRGNTPFRKEQGLLRMGFFSHLPRPLLRRCKPRVLLLEIQHTHTHTRRLYPSLGTNTVRSFQFAHQSVCCYWTTTSSATWLTAALTDGGGLGPTHKVKKSSAKVSPVSFKGYRIYK